MIFIGIGTGALVHPFGHDGRLPSKFYASLPVAALAHCVPN
jgi:hypothetical protein